MNLRVLISPNFRIFISSSLHDHCMICALQIKYMCTSQPTKFHVSKRKGFYIFKFHNSLAEKKWLILGTETKMQWNCPYFVSMPCSFVEYSGVFGCLSACYYFKAVSVQMRVKRWNQLSILGPFYLGRIFKAREILIINIDIAGFQWRYWSLK